MNKVERAAMRRKEALKAKRLFEKALERYRAALMALAGGHSLTDEQQAEFMEVKILERDRPSTGGALEFHTSTIEVDFDGLQEEWERNQGGGSKGRGPARRKT